MKNFFTIKQAAEIVGMTSETLRHYDRIGLVKPCHIDKTSQYRYYSEHELVRLQTVSLLKQMDLSLSEIDEILRQNDLSRVIALLRQAEKSADEKIARLQYAKAKIKAARTDYEKKQSGSIAEYGESGWKVKRFPSRVLLISDHMEHPSLTNLWNYHSHFYRQLGEAKKAQYLFEDLAGMITYRDKTRLFAVCTKYPSLDGLTVLPQGDYLCATCTEENKEAVIKAMLEKVRLDYKTEPQFLIQNIVVIGVLQWSYQVQVFLGG